MHCQCFYSAVRANSKLDYSIHNVEMSSIFCLFPLLARIAECSLPESQNAWELQSFPESQNVWKLKKLQVSSGFQSNLSFCVDNGEIKLGVTWSYHCGKRQRCMTSALSLCSFLLIVHLII